RAVAGSAGFAAVRSCGRPGPDNAEGPRSLAGAGLLDDAVLTGFEPAASTLTGWRALQTAPQDQVCGAVTAVRCEKRLYRRVAAGSNSLCVAAPSRGQRVDRLHDPLVRHRVGGAQRVREVADPQLLDHPTDVQHLPGDRPALRHLLQ